MTRWPRLGRLADEDRSGDSTRMRHEQRVRDYVRLLVDAIVPPHLANPYRSSDAAQNLSVFLSRRDPLAETILLVGEAPGYRGAAVSGVPLASLSVLGDAWGDPWESFGPTAGYAAPATAPYRREATATIVWQALAHLFHAAPLPLTWNAVPFHPFGSSLQSNAPLAKRDLAIGQPWIEALLELFPSVLVVAVGARADDALNAIGVEHRVVRHPSRGGKADFAEGLAAISFPLDSSDDQRPECLVAAVPEPDKRRAPTHSTIASCTCSGGCSPATTSMRSG